MANLPPPGRRHPAKGVWGTFGIVVLLLTSLQTCSSEEDHAESDGLSGGDGGASLQGDCAGARPRDSICLTSVTGRVIDEEGTPVRDIPVTVCGPVCHRGVSDAEGNFVVEVGRFVSPSEYSVQPHGTPDRSTFYYPLPADLSDGSYDAGPLRILAFESVGDKLITKLDLGGQTSPAQAALAGPVRLSISEGTVVRLPVGDALLPEDAGKFFRATPLSEAQMEEIAPNLGALAVYALGPFEAAFEGQEQTEPRVSVSFNNDFSLPPGQRVTVLALGTYLDPDWLSPSKFESIGEAVVSADGTTVDLSEAALGPRLRHLTWLALGP